MKFHTKRFCLRLYEKSDYKEWRRAHDEMLPQTNPYDFNVLSPKMRSRERFLRMVRRHKSFAKCDVIYFFGVFERKTGRLVGKTSIELVDRFSCQSATLAYSIFNNHVRQGYATEAVEGTIKFAFKRLKLHRLEAPILPGNKPSLAFARAMGLQYEGLRRGAMYYDGRWADLKIYGLIAEDWGIRGMKPSR